MGIVRNFLSYYGKSNTLQKIQEPFIQKLLLEVLEDDRFYYAFGLLKSLRKRLEINTTIIDITDLGAGSRVHKSNQRSVKDILKTSVSPSWQCELLFRLVNFLQPKTKLELGTSLGLSTLYQHMPNTSATLYTLEGCPNLAQFATNGFKTYKAKNIHSIVGDFKETLPDTLKKIGQLDYAFLDGNHQKQPTIDYFEQCLPYCHNNTVLVFDDIHWSDGMQEAWEQIKKHPQVSSTLDLFYMGIVFFRQDFEQKEHYTIINSKYKPWKKLLNH
ncbi:MAG: class I SAM-dependent methyltransferase [Aureispira sp.]|nr:class I SAM-dependent methyltransferase [Aureispira sp.]